MEVFVSFGGDARASSGDDEEDNGGGDVLHLPVSCRQAALLEHQCHPAA